MTREQHLEYCGVCSKQKFDMQQGIVCGLTNKIADFEESCDSFEESSAYKETWTQKKRALHVIDNQAGANTRLTNYLLDGVIIFLLILGITWLVRQTVSAYTWYRIPILYFYLGYVGLQVAYYTLLEALTGKTIAKMITKTKVTNHQGDRPHLLILLVRSIIRLIPFEPFSFLNSESSGWHDKMTDTIVIYD